MFQGEKGKKEKGKKEGRERGRELRQSKKLRSLKRTENIRSVYPMS